MTINFILWSAPDVFLALHCVPINFRHGLVVTCVTEKDTSRTRFPVVKGEDCPPPLPSPLPHPRRYPPPSLWRWREVWCLECSLLVFQKTLAQGNDENILYFLISTSFDRASL